MQNTNIDDNLLYALIDSWLQQNLSKFTVAGSISVHINDLLSITGTLQQFYHFSLKAYQYLITKSLSVNAKPMLVLPLKSQSTQLLADVPQNFADLQSQFDDFEPPSLYLISWQPSKSTAPCEEYIVPLSFSLVDPEGNIYAYYREFRYKMGINNKWEFSRAVYLEHYPGGIITQ